jgi:hypothetical protein
VNGVENDTCDLCGQIDLEDPVRVEVERFDPHRWVYGYFCSWEHASAWFAAGEPKFEMVKLERVEDRRLWDRVEPTFAFFIFLWAVVLILIGAWTAANWLFPIQ